MKAIILAAGAGTRLTPVTNGLPKCLVPFGFEPLIDRQMRALHSAGVEDIVVVTGYEAARIRHHCGSRVGYTEVRYIENPDFATTNSIYSLHLAGSELDTDCFLVNCDIVFPPELAQRLAQAEHGNSIAVDSHVNLVAGEMNVVMQEGGLVTAIGKELNPDSAHAQSVQVVKFDAAGAGVVRDEVERLIRQGELDAFPTSAFGPLIEEGQLFAVEAGDLPWAEIDSLDDYNEALRFTLPRLS